MSNLLKRLSLITAGFIGDPISLVSCNSHNNAAFNSSQAINVTDQLISTVSSTCRLMGTPTTAFSLADPTNIRNPTIAQAFEEAWISVSVAA